MMPSWAVKSDVLAFAKRIFPQLPQPEAQSAHVQSCSPQGGRYRHLSEAIGALIAKASPSASCHEHPSESIGVMSIQDLTLCQTLGLAKILGKNRAPCKRCSILLALCQPQFLLPRRTCEMSATLLSLACAGTGGRLVRMMRLTQKECEEGEPNPKTIDGRRLTRRKKSWVNPTEHLTTGVNPGKHLI